MNRVKRILALTAVILLLGLYLAALIAAVFATPASADIFKACIIATIMIPIMLYVVFFIYRLIYPEKNENAEQLRKQIQEKSEGISAKDTKEDISEKTEEGEL